jgi:hypothetical protein
MAHWIHPDHDRDSRMIQHHSTRGLGRNRMLPPGVAMFDRSLLFDEMPFGLDTADYIIYRVDGWRVAVPVWEVDVHRLLTRLRFGGPKAINYIIVGDTIMPANLGRGERFTLAGYGR